MNLDFYFTNLKENTQNLLDTIDRIEEEKLTIKDGETWSILEILEHIYLTDKIIFTLLSTPTEHLSEQNEIIGRDTLEKIVIGKNFQKVKAPDVVYPKGLIHNITDFKALFLEQREQIQLSLESGNIKVDHRIFKHSYLGEMSIEDWLNLLLFHTKRHIQQIEEKTFE